jgi:hypothetical protein
MAFSRFQRILRPSTVAKSSRGALTRPLFHFFRIGTRTFSLTDAQKAFDFDFVRPLHIDLLAFLDVELAPPSSDAHFLSILPHLTSCQTKIDQHRNDPYLSSHPNHQSHRSHSVFPYIIDTPLT